MHLRCQRCIQSFIQRCTQSHSEQLQLGYAHAPSHLRERLAGPLGRHRCHFVRCTPAQLCEEGEQSESFVTGRDGAGFEAIVNEQGADLPLPAPSGRLCSLQRTLSSHTQIGFAGVFSRRQRRWIKRAADLSRAHSISSKYLLPGADGSSRHESASSSGSIARLSQRLSQGLELNF